MAKIKIVNNLDLSMASSYEADAPNQAAYGGPWGRSTETTHVQVPDGMDADCVVAQMSQERWSKEGETDVTVEPDEALLNGWTHHPSVIELVEDANLVADKTAAVRDAKLAKLRDLRDPKIEAADAQIQMHQDSDPNAVALEADWRTHRTALRNVTDDHKYANDASKGKATLDAYADDMSDFDGWPVEPS